MRRLLLFPAILGLGVTTVPAQTVPVDPALPAYHPTANIGGDLSLSGPDTMEGMAKAWVEAFKKYQSSARVTHTTKTCNPEDRSALGPDTDEVFANTTAPYAQKYRYEPFRVRVSMAGFNTPQRIDALGVYVHPQNPIRKLTLAELDAIYSSERRRGHPTDIRTWGNLGLAGEWADKPIHAYGRSLDNEVSWYFKDVVMFDGAYKSTYIQPGKAASVDVVGAVGNDRYGIGYSAFSYQTDKVKALALAGRDGVYAQPTLADVASGRYPLDRPLYLYVNRAPGKPLDPLVKEFLTFVLSKEGQEIVVKDQALALPAAIAAAERAKLK